MKEAQQLNRTIGASTDGQASTTGVGEMTIKACLRPEFGPNVHAEFLLTASSLDTFYGACAYLSIQHAILSFTEDILYRYRNYAILLHLNAAACINLAAETQQYSGLLLDC